MPYGTVMIAKVKVAKDDIVRELQDWERERKAPGYQNSHVMFADDGRVVNVVVFDSKESYMKLADDPEQDKWYQARVAPMLDGDPEWIDGEWVK